MEVLGFVTDDLREWRRLQAVALKRRGWVQRDIADALGASEVSVCRWLARAREHGPHALLARPAPGPGCRTPRRPSSPSSSGTARRRTASAAGCGPASGSPG